MTFTKGPSNSLRAYSRIKLTLAMFSLDLAAELAESGVTVNALHPTSLMETKLVREWIGTPRTSVEEGARHVERLAVSPDLDGLSGHYFEQDQRSRALAQAYDEKSRRRLRELSLGWTGLDARSGNKLG